MRTTITLEKDVEARLNRYMQETGLGFKAAVNEMLRCGMAQVKAGKIEESRFDYEAKPLGLKPGIDPARFNAIADELEADAFQSAQSHSADQASAKRKKP